MRDEHFRDEWPAITEAEVPELLLQRATLAGLLREAARIHLQRERMKADLRRFHLLLVGSPDC